MGTRRLKALLSVLAVFVLFSSRASAATDLVRGLVVDRGDDILWLGLSAPVVPGAVFNISLIPGNEILARATVIKCTADEPFVAQARYKLLVGEAFIPVGAYAEITGDTAPDTDELVDTRSVSAGNRSAGRLDIRAGMFFPSDSQLSDETASVWPMVQIGYQIGNSRGTSTEIGLSYYGRNGKFTDGAVPGRREFRAIPLTFDIRFPISRSQNAGWTVRAGVGAYMIHDKRITGDTETSESETSIGWQAGFGYTSSRGLSAELYYTSVSSTDLRGAVFSLGTRF